MQYSQDSLGFINKYYFKIKGKGSDNYETIVSITRVFIVFPLTLLVAFYYLGAKYIYPKLNVLMEKYLEKDKATKYAEKLGIKTTSMRSLAITCLILNLAFFVFHILSVIENIRYGNEILYHIKINLELLWIIRLYLCVMQFSLLFRLH